MDSDRCNGTFTASVAICIQQTVTLHFRHFNALFYSHLPWGDSAHFLQVQPITTCTVTTISFHQVPIWLSVQGQHWLETSTSTRALLSMICGLTYWYWTFVIPEYIWIVWYWTLCSFWSATIFILMIVTVSWWQLCQGSDFAQTALLCYDMLWWNIAGVGFCGKLVWA